MNNLRRPRQRNHQAPLVQQGLVVLFYCHFIVSLLLVTASAFLLQGSTELRHAEMSTTTTQEFWLAEAALDEVTYGLKVAPPELTVDQCTSPIEGAIAFLPGQDEPGSPLDDTPPAGNQAQGFPGPLGGEINPPEDVPLLDLTGESDPSTTPQIVTWPYIHRVCLVAQGQYRISAAGLAQDTSVGLIQTLVNIPSENVRFSSAILTPGVVDIVDAHIASVSSALDLVHQEYPSGFGLPSATGARGGIASVAHEYAVVVGITEDSHVKGDIAISNTLDPETAVVISADSTYVNAAGTGTISTFTEDQQPFLMSAISAPSDAIPLESLDLESEELRLPAGTYVVDDVVVMESLIYTDGPVVVYVTGKVEATRSLIYGQTVGFSSPVNALQANNLHFIATEEVHRPWKFKQGLLAAVVYNLYSPVLVKEGQLMAGAIVGNPVAVGESPEDPAAMTHTFVYFDEQMDQGSASIETTAITPELLVYQANHIAAGTSSDAFQSTESDLGWTPGGTPGDNGDPPKRTEDVSPLPWPDAETWSDDFANDLAEDFPPDEGEGGGDGEDPGGEGEGGGGGGCFLAGTPILLSDGTTKPIEAIQVGDVVLAFDEATGAFTPDAVKQLFVHPNETGYLIVNGHLRVTPNHPVRSEGRWIEIGQLTMGETLVNAQGEPEPITSIEVVPGTVTVYNLEINPYHTYIAGGVVVHNKDGDPVVMGPP